MIEGVDIASYQPSYTPGPGIDFVFPKASEGTGYRNPYGPAQAARARAKGCVIGWYHYLHRGNIQAQAEYFVSSPGIADGDMLFCDWEGSSIPSCAEKDQFIAAVKQLRPHSRVGLYCNSYTWRNVDTTSDDGDWLFIAEYGRSAPSIQHPWVVWQYSDGGGQLDHDRANFPTRAAMQAWAHGLMPAPVVTHPIDYHQAAPGSVITIGGRSYPNLLALRVAQTVLAQKAGYVSRNTWYVQEWLTAAGKYHGPISGKWDGPTQAAYNSFRRSIGYTGRDAVGVAGITSLTRLRDAVHAHIPIKPF